jgi:uncharacterized protein (DUF885 family)
MIRFSHFATLALVLGALAGCGHSTPPPVSGSPAPAAPADRLRGIVERYWDENAARIPWYSWGGSELQFGDSAAQDISPPALADSLDIERRYLAELTAVPRSSLSADARLTYDLFRRERALAIEGFTYPFELLPINPFDGMPQQFAMMSVAAQPQALSSAGEYDRWTGRALRFVGWTTQAIVNLRDGLRRGVILPRVLVERAIPQLAALGEDGPANPFYQSLPEGALAAGTPERLRLTNAMKTLLKERVLPSYRALHDFLQQEYLPRSRATVGWSALPLGDAWYAYRVRRTAGIAATPAQLHALGVTEVERLQRVLHSILADASFPGTAQDYLEGMSRDPRFSYTDAGELLRAYEDLKAQSAAAAAQLFSTVPAGDYVIRSVEPFRESTAPLLSYRPRAPNGITQSTLYVNTGRLEARPATSVIPLFLREAVPGHHLQIALQQERADLPRFRRFGGAPAFSEGWGLYAQTLGEELGLYHDSQARFAAALAELRCAAGLVIDTGMHSQHWTRAQALDYVQHQVPIDDVDARLLVDRAVALPAHELACTVGYLKIKALRASAQQALGARFELRAFHEELLRDGALPLDLLDAKMTGWIARELAAPPKAPDPPSAAVAAQSKLD